MAPKTRYFVVAILALGFADGAISFFLYPGQSFAPSSLVMSIVALFFTFVWYRLDSDSREFKRTPLMSIAVVGIGIVALPYFLMRRLSDSDSSPRSSGLPGATGISKSIQNFL
jgi:hypothetical protein